jgi:cytochrome P450
VSGLAPDLVSRMIHSASMGAVPPREYLGHLVLLIIGGNDTTRSTLAALPMVNRLFPNQWEQVAAKPALIPNAVQELVRWQTPIAHMRRTALHECEIGGRTIRPGEKVVLWYASANRDEDMFADADAYVADRPNARRHLSFGAGAHRCLGARLAQLQVSVLFETLLARGLTPVQTGPAERTPSSFIHGFRTMPARLVRA